MQGKYPEAPVVITGDSKLQTRQNFAFLSTVCGRTNQSMVPTREGGLKRRFHSALQCSEDSTAQLQGSLAWKDWDIFCGGSLNKRVEVITDSVKFCIPSTIPVKAIKKYSNSKPWITPDIIHSLSEKRKTEGLPTAGLDLPQIHNPANQE